MYILPVTAFSRFFSGHRLLPTQVLHIMPVTPFSRITPRIINAKRREKKGAKNVDDDENNGLAAGGRSGRNAMVLEFGCDDRAPSRDFVLVPTKTTKTTTVGSGCKQGIGA